MRSIPLRTLSPCFNRAGLLAGPETELIIRLLAGDSLSTCPPLIISSHEIDQIFDIIGRALDKTLDWAKRDKLLAA